MSEEQESKNDQNSLGEEVSFDANIFGISAETEIKENIDESAQIADEAKVDQNDQESLDDVEDKEKPPSNDTKDDSSLVTVLGGDLYEKGVLSNFNEKELTKIVEEKGEAEAYRHILTSELDSIKSKTKELYDDQFKEFTRLREVGYSPEEATQNISIKEQLESISEEAFAGEEAEDLVKNLMSAQLKQSSQMNDAEIEKYVQYQIDSSEDNGVAEGKNALTFLKEGVKNQEESFIQQQEANRIQQENDLKELQSKLKSSIKDTKEFIKGVEVNDSVKDRMYSIMTEAAGEIEGRPVNAVTLARSKDPQSFDMKVAYALATGYFDSDKPWEKIARVAETKASGKLDNFLQNQKTEDYRWGNGSEGFNTNKKEGGNPFDDFLQSKK